MRFTSIAAGAIACVLTSAGGGAQTSHADDPLARLSFLIARWAGTGEGQPGTSRVRREYSPALGDKCIRAVNESRHPRRKENPRGELHRTRGFSATTAPRRA